MKKLKLNVANLGATEILTREELKKVLGGADTGSGSGSETCTNNACGALNLPCCSAYDICSAPDKSGVCVPRKITR